MLLSACASAACAAPESREWTLRIMPEAVTTNASPRPFRLGFPVGLLEGEDQPFRAECLRADTLEAGADVRLETVADPASASLLYRVANAGSQPGSISLASVELRRGVAHTVRVACRRLQGRGDLRFRWGPVGADLSRAVEQKAKVKGDRVRELRFAVAPPKDGAYRCAFVLEPGAAFEFLSFSMVADDAEEGFGHEQVAALRTVSPGELLWPSRRDVGVYNWYDGVGPRALRRGVSRADRLGVGHDFGTVEFVAFCRLIGAEPVIRVPVAEEGAKPACGEADGQAEGAQRAADWVAYCNASGDEPLAELRRRHGHPEPLRVTRWVLTAADGGPPSHEAAAYRAAMERVCPGLEVRMGESELASASDSYVAKVLRRVALASEQDKAYFTEWYTTLGLAYAAVEHLRRGEVGDVLAPCHPEEALTRATYARSMLSEAGWVMALFNRYPAAEPLVTEGGPQEAGAPFRVQAAWAEGRTTLLVFVYNSGPEARTVTLDLRPMRRRFAFWVADQLAADIAARRVSRTLPVSRVQTAGPALTQVVTCEAQPSSVTRIVVQEFSPKGTGAPAGAQAPVAGD